MIQFLPFDRFHYHYSTVQHGLFSSVVVFRLAVSSLRCWCAALHSTVVESFWQVVPHGRLTLICMSPRRAQRSVFRLRGASESSLKMHLGRVSWRVTAKRKGEQSRGASCGHFFSDAWVVDLCHFSIMFLHTSHVSRTDKKQKCRQHRKTVEQKPPKENVLATQASPKHRGSALTTCRVVSDATEGGEPRKRCILCDC